MSTFEEDSTFFTFASSDDSYLEDSSFDSLTDDSWISETCSNDSPITLVPYDKDDYNDIFTIKVPNAQGKFKKGTCLTKGEFANSLLSDRSKERPDYIMSIYTTPKQEEDYLTGMTGKPTLRMFVRVISNQMYITLGSAKRIFEESSKTWYALPLFGGKRRRIGNILGTYGASMNHGQVPGFVVYKLFTREEIINGAQGVDTLEDYLIIPNQTQLLPFMQGWDSISPSKYTKMLIDAVVPKRHNTTQEYEHGIEDASKIVIKEGYMCVFSEHDIAAINIETKDIYKLEKTHYGILQADVKEGILYLQTQSEIFLIDLKTKKQIGDIQASESAFFSCMLLTEDTLYTGDEDGIVKIHTLPINEFQRVEKVSFKANKNESPITSIEGNGEYIYVGDADGTLKKWKTGTKPKLMTSSLGIPWEGGSITTIKISMDKKALYAILSQGDIVRIDFENDNSRNTEDLGSSSNYSQIIMENDRLYIQHGRNFFKASLDLKEIEEYDLEEATSFAIYKGKMYVQQEGELSVSVRDS